MILELVSGGFAALLLVAALLAGYLAGCTRTFFWVREAERATLRHIQKATTLEEELERIRFLLEARTQELERVREEAEDLRELLEDVDCG